jgi:tryptophan synthase alpha chain
MSRISEKFVSLHSIGRKGFIPFVTAGDPDIPTSLSIIEALTQEGADIIELGVPFSDPMADGPVIQASSQRALANGVSLKDVLDLAKSLRSRSDVPVVLFSYLNPLLQYGIARLRDEAANFGIDGILITDVVDDEATEISDILAEKDIDLISLVAPTTSDARLEEICAHARGFIYAVSRAGVTGAREDMSEAAERLVRRITKYAELPIAVGFGISTRSQVEDVWRFADAAVVGSAIVAEIAKAKNSEAAVNGVQKFVRSLLPQFAKTPTGI